MLASVDYKTLHTKYYHINDLKSLTRARNSLIYQRSKHLVQITNALDVVFPEFKPFFSNKLGSTALFILSKYNSKDKISKITSEQYKKLHSISRSEEHTSELQSRPHLVCRLLLEKK